MKRLAAFVALTSAFTLAACDEPRSYDETDDAEIPAEAPVAPAVEEVAVPAAAPSATDTPPDASALPSDKRTSEESVQPESETLFY